MMDTSSAWSMMLSLIMPSYDRPYAPPDQGEDGEYKEEGIGLADAF